MQRSVFWGQVLALTSANLRSRYRKTWAGFIWVILNPVLMFGVQSLVFHRFLNVQVPNYLLFLLSGLLPWIFFVQSVEMCTSVFVNSGPMLKSFQIDPLVPLVAQIMDNLVNFLGAFFVLLVPIWFLQPAERLHLVLMPIALLILAAGTFGITWILATLQVYYRDTRFVVSFAISILFFLTPIFYPSSLVPEQWRWLSALNPVYHLIQPFRATVYHFEWQAFVSACVGGSMVALLSLAIGGLLWQRWRTGIYLNV